MSATNLLKADSVFGRWIGSEVNSFIKASGIHTDFIASHGHTVYHNPKERYTLQIGSGEEIHSATGIVVINDFRSLDLAKGGQGAPLVPIFDYMLLSQYAACLNLGGISNFTVNTLAYPLAGDICATNQMLNYISNRMGREYDEGGENAASGSVLPNFLEKLRANPFYKSKFPKALSNEMIAEYEIPLIDSLVAERPEDLLMTCIVHISEEINFVLNDYLQSGDKVLVTGGGAFNKFLVESLRESGNLEYIIPSSNIIAYKEAIAFAFLGALRLQGQKNCYATVTGATSDSSCGTIIG